MGLIRKQKLLGAKAIEIGLKRWLELGPEDWRLIHDRLQGRASRPKPRIPRPHQKQAIQAARNYYVKQK